MDIIVLAGGTSTERDISIMSGREVAKALCTKGHNVYLLDVFFGCGDEVAEHIFEAKYDIDALADAMRDNSDKICELSKSRRQFIGKNVVKVCRRADAVFLALHGANGEDGKIQALFDLYGIKYSGTGYLSSAIAMDKSLSKQFFKWNGIPTPKGGEIGKDDEDKGYDRFGISLPVVVKPCCGGSSVGVTIASTDDEYAASLREAFSYEDRVVVEEYVRGREFSVAVVDDVAYPVIEIAPIEGFYDYKNKYSAGSTIETCPADLPKETSLKMQKLAVDGAKALGITGYCRLDFMMNDLGEIYCLEANTLPGMTPTSLIPQEAAAVGVSFPELCEKLLGL